MKVGIIAGGKGTRLAEETQIKPKTMVEIGGRPILWHIMRHYAHYNNNDFVIALGYKGEVIKRYIVDYASLSSNLTVNLRSGNVSMDSAVDLDLNVELIDTGQETMTGGRIKRLQPYMGNETCMVTWSDAVSNIDLDALIAFHKSHGKLATLTAVRPPARFGHMVFEGDNITEFKEKPQTGEGWINGAYFVLEPGAFDYIEGDHTQFEHEPLANLAKDGQLMAFRHNEFWQCMDTLREKNILEQMWQTGDAPWKIWE